MKRLLDDWFRGWVATVAVLAILLSTFGSIWGGLAVLRLLIGLQPWSPETSLWSLALTAVVAPLVVVRSWLSEMERP